MWNIIVEPRGTRSRGWQAHLHGDSKVMGVGRTKDEAVAALWIQVVGKLILENPVPFGLAVSVLE